MSSISVVIPTYNRRTTLLLALNALSMQSIGSDRFEVLVVDDGSTDDTADAVRSFRAPYGLRLVGQANAGPSTARNRGAREAVGELLVYIDDDIEPVETFVAEHARCHAGQADLVLVGPQSPPPGERCPVWIDWEHRMLERQYERFRTREWDVKPSNLYSGNFSVRREHYLSAGGFDEAMFRQEDVDFGMRLANLGLRFDFAPEAVGYHRPTRPFSSWYTTPYLYGQRDVQLARDKGQSAILDLARYHYRGRSRLTRVLARLCIGRAAEGVLLGGLRHAIPTSDRVIGRRATLGLCSLAFNLRYLQGMAHEMGGAARMWDSLLARAR